MVDVQSSRATSSLPAGRTGSRVSRALVSRGWQCRYTSPFPILDRVQESRVLVGSPIPEGQNRNSESRGPELQLIAVRQTMASACFQLCTSGSGFAANLLSARTPEGFSKRRSKTLQHALRVTGQFPWSQPSTADLEILIQRLPHPNHSAAPAILVLGPVAWHRSRCARFQAQRRYRALLPEHVVA
jgi:hypothetical protein